MTPAPWFKGCTWSNGAQIVTDNKVNGTYDLIATVHANGDDFEANAKLIAAAPDLLEVVRAMANFDGRNNNKHLKDMARAAIAKATGATA